MSTKRSAPESLTDLPSDVLVGILARLPLRTLFVSRSVCKTFLLLTTNNPYFIDLHSSNAAQILLLQFGAFCNPPCYLLRLADPELDHSAPQNSQLKPLFQLPTTEDPTNFPGENSFFLANSCNGLVYFFKRFAGDDRSLVCNPVTNEYVVVPEVGLKIRSRLLTKSMWLGFSPVVNQYKALSVFYWNNILMDGGFGVEVEVKAQVFVIGSDSWRDIDDTPSQGQLSWDLCSTLVNGFMYWFDRFWTDVVSFDFETEKFGEVPLPAEEQYINKQLRSIGVLGGCLCLCCNDFFAHRVDLWVMRKCGNQDSWSKEFVVDTVSPTIGSIYGLLKPLQFLQNGEILMLWMGNDLVCYDPRTETLRYFGLHRLRMAHRAVALTPSFVPLKDTLRVENVLRQIMRPRGDEEE